MWSDFITSVQCLQKLSFMMIGNICVGENKRAGRDGAHQLYTLLHVNSFSWLGITPQINWFYLPALVSSLEMRKKVCYVYLLYCFLASVDSLQSFCLFFFAALSLHLRHDAAASDLSTEKPKPMLSCLHVVTLLRSWLWREEGHYQNTKHSQLPIAAPAALEAEEILPYFVIVSGFAKS